MRKIITTAAVIATTLVAFATPSLADGFYFGIGDGYGNGYGGGHRHHHRQHRYEQSYDNYGYGGDCWIKKIRFYDDYGNRHVKKVRVCN